MPDIPPLDTDVLRDIIRTDPGLKAWAEAVGGAETLTDNFYLVEQLGDTTMLYASTKGGQPLTISLEGQLPIAVGGMVTTYVDPARYHVFGADGVAI